MEKIIILKDSLKKIKRFNLQGRTIDFKFKPIPENAEPVSWFKSALEEVIFYAAQNLRPHDKVGFKFCNKNFERGEAWIKFEDAREISIDNIFNIIQGIHQSNSLGLNTDTFCLSVTSVRMPEGLGHARRRKDKSFDVESARRKGIIVIKNKDNLCLPRAIVVAIAKIMEDREYKKIRVVDCLQKKKALQLCKEADVIVPSEGCGLRQLQDFQNVLRNKFKITVYKYGTKGRDVIFEGPSAPKDINLLFHENHYNVITSCTAAFCCSYYCNICHIPFEHKNRHRCLKTCASCQQMPPCEEEIKIRCGECLRIFKNQKCLDNHKKIGSLGKSSICKEVRLCSYCLKVIRSDRVHTCGEIYCKICHKHTAVDHFCFMQVDKATPNMKSTLFIFFDFETRQETILEDGSLLHEVNLCVFKQFCDYCRETEPWLCEKCGVINQILTINPVERFVEYIFNASTLFKKVVVISHNGGGFDNQFILNNLLTQTNYTPELIMRGTKIILMHLSNISFLDSLNYFPMALSVLPKVFGLPDKFKKGYFPHLFNTLENEAYVGPMPPMKYYDPENMMPEQRQDFLKWYKKKLEEESTFNFKKELIEYCKSDVSILFESCKLFQQQMLETTGVDPFTEASTIASCCSKIFRRNYLRENEIGIIPKRGYRNRDIQSKIALEWLIWEENQRQINVVHNAKKQEVKLNGMKVDGYCYETNQAFEFHGCYWHGCPVCFKYQRDQPLYDCPNETLNYRYESTNLKIERLEELGYEVIQKWECEFRLQNKKNPKIAQFTQNHSLLSQRPLNPRDAFYGGRTGNCKTYYKVQNNEKINYFDVCSLYPWVCKYGKFPVGHPEVILGEKCNELDLFTTDGIIKLKILPPQDLYHPVLPIKMNSKLMFVLCQKCGQELNYNECSHNESERAFVGTWVIDEVLKAIEKGYIILEIYEIWKYKVEQYNETTRTGGLFVEMMNKFMKIKQEASGWPCDIISIEQKYEYIEKFSDKEGILLEFQNITKNSGLRSLAKLILNSFWGKFGQLESQPKTKIINNPHDLFSILTTPSLEVNTVQPVNENTVLVNYQLIQECYDPLATVNVAIAAYTTAQARLKLYSYLDQLQDRVLYYDTDSIIFTQKDDDEYKPSKGEFIGDMTDELECYGPGSYITEFASGGPKNYAYKIFSTSTNTEKVVCKVKGIKLCHEASKLVNFETIRNMILEKEEPVSITRTSIRRTKLHEVVTKKESKEYRTNSLKRKFQSDYDSVPYGFKKNK